jgi:hypothetical protein
MKTFSLMPSGKLAIAYQKQKAKQRLSGKAGVESVVGYLKSDHLLNRNFLKNQLLKNILC